MACFGFEAQRATDVFEGYIGFVLVGFVDRRRDAERAMSYCNLAAEDYSA